MWLRLPQAHNPPDSVSQCLGLYVYAVLSIFLNSRGRNRYNKPHILVLFLIPSALGNQNRLYKIISEEMLLSCKHHLKYNLILITYTII